MAASLMPIILRVSVRRSNLSILWQRSGKHPNQSDQLRRPIECFLVRKLYTGLFLDELSKLLDLSSCVSPRVG